MWTQCQITRVWCSRASFRRICTRAERESAPAQAHHPVLLEEVKRIFSKVDLKVYVDGTVGAGGHAKALQALHPEMQHLLGFDQDMDALAEAMKTLRYAADPLAGGTSLELISKNFRHLEGELKAHGLWGQVDGVLLDLGVSSMQLDRAERGFSFMRSGPLDMRMDQRTSVSALDIVNTWPEQHLGQLLRERGEEKNWRAVARRIVDTRECAPIDTTEALVAAVGRTHRGHSARKTAALPHPATRTFQALRIAVNDELGALSDVLPAAIQALRPGGRLAVITFHSLEDRIVKWAFREAAGRGRGLAEAAATLRARGAWLEPTGMGADCEGGSALVKEVTRRPVVASARELAENPRARSAKLRAVERI